VFTELLPSDDTGDKDRHTDRWDGFIKYAVEMGSEAMIYILSFVNIGSSIHELKEGIQRDTTR
jgi:hypothetical protein